MSRETRIAQALSKPLIGYEDFYEGNGWLYQACSAFLYLVLEEHEKPEKTTRERILEHIRNLIAGGNEPMFTAGPFWHYESLSLALAVVRHTPSVWEKLTAAEQDKLDLLMRCYAIGTAFVSNDCNFYMTGPSLTANYGKNWNPNHRMAMVFPIVAAYLYFSASQPNPREYVDGILTEFDHDAYVRKFEEYGFTRAKYCWTTKGILLEDGTKAPDAKELMMEGGRAYLSVMDSGSKKCGGFLGKDLQGGEGVRRPFLYHGLDLDAYREIANDLYRHNYSGGRVISDTSSKNGGCDEEGNARCYILDGTRSPVEGREGMMKELVAGDGHGFRSSTSYCMHDFVLVTESMAALTAIGGYNAKDYPQLFEMICVGNADVIYKGEHGYRSYSLGGGYDTYEGEDNYLMWKDYWLEKYSQA